MNPCYTSLGMAIAYSPNAVNSLGVPANIPVFYVASSLATLIKYGI